MKSEFICILIYLDSADPLSSSYPCNDPPWSKYKFSLTIVMQSPFYPALFFSYAEENLDADHS